MRYLVTFVSDAALPAGMAWAFARQAGSTYLFVKQSSIDVTTGRCDALTDAWEAWQRVEREDMLRGLRGSPAVRAI